MSQLLLEVRHACPKVEQRVRKWFTESPRIVLLDGSRSVRLPHPEKCGKILKIKGAGFMGGKIKLGTHHGAGPASPLFDFDGRRMEDVASGHNNAYLGAASFQQAAVEYETSQRLASLGYSVVPCIGYGRVQQGDCVAWFSLFEYEKDWINVDEYLDANIENGRLLLEFAVKHNLVGYFWFVQAPKGRWFLKDLHPFREVSPLNMSQISWTLQVITAMYIRCEACKFFGTGYGLLMGSDELASTPLRSILPDASAQDYRDLKSNIFKPYIEAKPKNFSSERLFESLYNTRITRALLEICPVAYARWKNA